MNFKNRQVNKNKMSNTTAFQKVCNFMKIANQTEVTTDLSNTNLIKFRLSLIEEEFQELKDALKDKDISETRDAIADILYVVYGAAKAFGIDADKDFDEVHNSNMSKFCLSEEEARHTVQWYKINKSCLYDSPVYEKIENVWVVKNRSTGKILKSIKYKPVSFT